MSNSNRPYEEQTRRPVPSLFWPIVLIASGVTLLLSNLGYLPTPSWNLLWRLWPILLIALGVDTLIGRRSVLGAILSGLLILLLIGSALLLVFFARNIPALAELARAPELHTETITYPLDDLEQATMRINWPSLDGSLGALDDSGELIAGDVATYGEIIFDVDVIGDQAAVRLDSVSAGPVFHLETFDTPPESQWEIWLNPDVALDLILDTGSGRYTFDLRELQVSDLNLNTGSGDVDLLLPTAGDLTGSIDGGSGDLDITLPPDVGLRIEIDNGSGSFRTDERFVLVEGQPDDNGIWETENYRTAETNIRLKVNQGSGDIRIR